MKPQMEILSSAINVCRVLDENDDFLTVEIAKNNQISFTLDPDTPDQFLTLIFVRKSQDEDDEDKNNVMEVWKPWDE